MSHDDRVAHGMEPNGRSGPDIGTLPPVRNPSLRDLARKSLRIFCEAYERQKFIPPWSWDQLRAIDAIEGVVLRDGLIARDLHRGCGKTTLIEAALTWAALYGHRRFSVLFEADQTRAIAVLANIQVELETNLLLLDDFPEVCYPVRCLEGIANRCKGQTYGGEPTYIGWSDKEIVLPTILGSSASGCSMRACGLHSDFTGMVRRLPDGQSIRPDFVAVDSPHTVDSAASASQREKVARLLECDVIELAGPAKRIAGIMLADEILDREKLPSWD